MGVRTPDLRNAIAALYQLSYDPLVQNEADYACAEKTGKEKNRIRTTG